MWAQTCSNLQTGNTAMRQRSIEPCIMTLCHSLSFSSSSTDGVVPPPFPSFPGWVSAAPQQFSVSPVLCRHRRSLLLPCPSWVLVYGCGLRLFGPTA